MTTRAALWWWRKHALWINKLLGKAAKQSQAEAAAQGPCIGNPHGRTPCSQSRLHLQEERLPGESPPLGSVSGCSQAHTHIIHTHVPTHSYAHIHKHTLTTHTRVCAECQPRADAPHPARSFRGGQAVTQRFYRALPQTPLSAPAPSLHPHALPSGISTAATAANTPQQIALLPKALGTSSVGSQQEGKAAA